AQLRATERNKTRRAQAAREKPVANRSAIGLMQSVRWHEETIPKKSSAASPITAQMRSTILSTTLATQ
ncbi:MAG TPA: hypothetical protein VJR26_14360, partial [Candidatus Acidoferrales bacterium]|nr:hypothetical protein [Candidatus Acidoferrales bacterium]